MKKVMINFSQIFKYNEICNKWVSHTIKYIFQIFNNAIRQSKFELSHEVWIASTILEIRIVGRNIQPMVLVK